MRRLVRSNRTRPSYLAIPLAICVLGATSALAQDNSPPVASYSLLSDHYIVVFKDSVEHPERVADAQIENYGGDRRFIYRHALKGFSAVLPKSAAQAIALDPRVAYIEHDAPGGVAAQTTPTGISRIFATSNKALSIDGSDNLRADVDVAVIDSGIDYEHPDLNVVARTDCSNGASKSSECTNESGTDVFGHGTHVAGTIAAIDNGSGVVGVAPGARLWSVKVVDSEGSGELSEYIAGLDWVTARAGEIEVANSSLRYFTTSSLAFSEAMKASIEAGVVHVAAAGNENEAVKYVPGNYADVITVSAIADYDGASGAKGSATCANYGLDDRKATFSNYGSIVDITAPGVCIYSTIPGNKYAYDSGTSMAAPHVTGAAAILASLFNPNSKADVESIRETLVKAGNKGWTDTSGDGIQEPLLDVSSESTFTLSNGTFYLRNSNSAGEADIVATYGATADRPVIGDWNNDGAATVGVKRSGDFYLRNSNSTGSPDLIFSFGNSEDLPVAGDWNNDGTDTIGVYRPSNRTFYLRNSNSNGAADITVDFGNSGDLPLVGDWNNDGTDTIGVYRPSNRTFYLRNSNSNGAADITVDFGNSGDLPLVGDWNNDGTDTIGVYRPSNTTFYLRNSNSNGAADVSAVYGSSGDTPIVGDWNKDGTTTIGAIR